MVCKKISINFQPLGNNFRNMGVNIFDSALWMMSRDLLIVDNG